MPYSGSVNAASDPVRRGCLWDVLSHLVNRRFSWRIQTTAAPPERVSDSLTNRGGAEVPKGHYLTEATKEEVWELRAEGLSDREIGRRLGLARGTVSGYLARAGGIRRGPDGAPSAASVSRSARRSRAGSPAGT